MNGDRGFRKPSPDVFLQNSGNAVRIVDGHLRIDFDVKFHKANMPRFARAQLMKTVDGLFHADHAADKILFFPR